MDSPALIFVNEAFSIYGDCELCGKAPVIEVPEGFIVVQVEVGAPLENARTKGTQAANTRIIDKFIIFNNIKRYDLN